MSESETESSEDESTERHTYRVPMKMVKTTEIEVAASSEDEAAEKVEPPRDIEAEKALQQADWKFEEYQTDFTWGIERTD